MEGRLILIVMALMVSVTPGMAQMITTEGCGVTKLCVETPNHCDPAGNLTCQFASVASSTPVSTNNTTLSFNLQGQSSGYVALGLLPNVTEAATLVFVCGQNSSANGMFFFSAMQKNNTNGLLIPTTNQQTTGTNGSVSGGVIKCAFSFSTNDIIYSILLGNGTYNMSGFGPFEVFWNSSYLNLTSPASNMNSTSAPGTSAPGTSAPGTSAPGTSAPGTSAPGTSAPGTSAPSGTGTSAPSGTGTSAPSTSAPSGNGTSAPSTSAPSGNGTSAPSTSAPSGNGTWAPSGNSIPTVVPTVPTTTKATGASCALHSHAMLLLLSVLAWSILQEA